MTLANGHYKLFWTFAGEHGSAMHKVFRVACKATPTPSPSPSSSSPVSDGWHIHPARTVMWRSRSAWEIEDHAA